MGNTTDRLALVVGVSLLSSLATLLAVGEIQVLFRGRGRGAETERLSEAPQSMHVLSAVAPNASEAPLSPRSPPSAPATSERPRQLDHYSWVTSCMDHHAAEPDEPPADMASPTHTLASRLFYEDLFHGCRDFYFDVGSNVGVQVRKRREL